MSDPDNSRNPGGQDWQGFREVDRAIAEDRLTAYTWKKTWADPWGRLKVIFVTLLFAAFLIYLVIDEVNRLN